jgi:hypothetical protein
MHVMEVPLRVAIVLTVLVQESLNPMAVADNLLDGMDNNLLKVAVVNLKVDNNLLKVINLKVDNLMVDNLKVALNNHLKVASKNLLAVDDLITLHLRILKLASR